MWRIRFASSRSSTGLRSQGSISAATRAAHEAPAMPDDAEAEEGGNPRELELVVAGEEVLDRGQDPVPRPPSRSATQANGIPSGAVPGSSGVQIGVVGERLAVLGRNPLRRVVGVAAGERPTDVVQDQQRHPPRGGRPLVDQPELLAQREVVVVTVDDDRVGRRARAAPRGWSPRSAPAPDAMRRSRAGPAAEPGRSRSPWRLGARPLEHLARGLAVKRADLDDRPGPAASRQPKRISATFASEAAFSSGSVGKWVTGAPG